MVNVHLFDGLAPVDLLQLTAQLVTDNPVNPAALQQVSVVFDRDQAALVVPIVVPLVKEWATYDRLKREYAKMPGAVGEPREEAIPAGARPLWSALPRALLLARRKNNMAELVATEFLLIADNLTSEQAVELMQTLSVDATAVKLANARDSGERTVRLYHVLADGARKATFESAYQSGQFGACRLLYCHRRKRNREEQRVFLPRPAAESDLDATALAYFCDILQGAPQLFGFSPAFLTPREHGLLAALEEQQSGDLWLYPLAGLHFRTWEEIAAAPPAHVAVRCVDLRDSADELPRLRDKIRQAEPFIGYRLQLLPTRFTDEAQMEEELIIERLMELEERLAGLRSIRQQRPLLARFSQRQLPALADALRRSPTGVLRSGALQYGFQATVDQPLGQHFIFAAPDAPQDALAGLCAWADHEPPPMRFWLDPFWAGHYHDGGNAALIFTPQGTALFPTLHSWDAAEMDTYLAEMINAWYAAQPADSAAGERLTGLQSPIYLFEPGSSASQLNISILDLAAFRPLYTQLGWLNDNLLVHDDLKTESFIHELADAAVRKRLLDQRVELVDVAQKEFAEAEQKVRAALAAKTVALTDAITGELDALFGAVKEAMDDMKAQRSRLEKLRRWAADMKVNATQLETLITQVNEEAKITEAATAELRQQASGAIQAAHEERSNVEAMVAEEIKRLKEAEQGLLRALERLRFPGY